MTLSERMHAVEDCAVVGCERHRVTDSLFCKAHLDAMWRNRLDRLPDGTFTERRQFTAREEWGGTPV